MRFWPKPAAPSSAVLISWLGRLATLAMLALLGWLGATIFWSLTAPQTPQPITTLETDAQRAVQAIAGRHLFGIAPAVPVASGSVISGSADIKLTGAIAAQEAGGQGFAILSIEGKPPQVVREGAEITPGVVLQRVLTRQVELLRNGQKQTLNLPEGGKGGTGQNPSGPMLAQPMPAGQMPTMPPQPVPGQMPPPPSRNNPA